MVNQHKLYLLNDSLFKTMFKESKSFRDMLNKIFKAYFNFDLDEFNITSEELTLDNIRDIKNRVDLLLKLENDNYFVNIEVNNGDKDYYPNRNFMYACKIVLSVFRKTEDYIKKFKVVQININDTICPLDSEIESTTLMLKDNKNDIVDERLVIHNLYLGKYKKSTYNKLYEMEKNLAMLVCDSIEEMEKLANGDKLREKIMSEYKRKISKEEFLEALFDPEWDRQCIINSEKILAREEGLKEGLEEGRAEGIAEGRKEGIEQGIEQVARSLLNANMPVEEISKHTKLSIQELESIKNN